MSERDILDRLFYFHDGYRRSDLSEGDEITLMIDADEEIRSLRARLERAEAERDELVEQQIAAVDDLQTARNDALAGAQDYLRRLPSFGDGKWAANHLEALKSPTPDQGGER